MNNVIEVNNLVKEFKTRVRQKGFTKKLLGFFAPKYKVIRAVNDVSFSIKEGELVAFIGPNGAGKSTTIKMLSGILYPTSGSINVLGLNPTKQRIKLSYAIGSVVGQKEQLWVHLSPYDNFKFYGTIFDIPKKQLLPRIDELVNLFGVEDFLHQPVKSLSLGQRMKCELIASLLHNPKILFFDEPTIGMDPIAKETLRDLIKRINKELNTTILFTSHDVGDIEEVCKRVIIINEGKVVLNDSVKNLKYKYLNKKILEIVSKEPIKLKSTDAFLVLKDKERTEEYAVKIEVNMDKTTINDVLALIDSNNIIDVSISSTPLENIIKEIYKKGGNK